ncbi:Bbp19 family protein [Pacificimonas sp. ICDLI1SI03]
MMRATVERWQKLKRQALRKHYQALFDPEAEAPHRADAERVLAHLRAYARRDQSKFYPGEGGALETARILGREEVVLLIEEYLGWRPEKLANLNRVEDDYGRGSE